MKSVLTIGNKKNIIAGHNLFRLIYSIYSMLFRSLSFLLVILSPAAAAQQIKADHLYNTARRDAFARIVYENDFFAGTDRYYTQGIYATVVSPSLGKVPVYKLTLRPAGNSMKYGLAIQQNAYTPTSVSDTALRRGDHPYAASLAMQLYTIATDAERKQRITSTITAGIMGRAAGGEWLQKNIHKLTDNYQPRGWHHQIANSIVLNYGVYYERNLVALSNILAVNVTGNVDAGTFNTSLALGTQITVGYLQQLFTEQAHRSRIRFNIYTHPQLGLVGYNAMLQGGPFSRDIYTIPSKDVSRLLFLNNYGAVVYLNDLVIEYHHCFSSPTFKGANAHTAGGISICFPL